MAINVLKAVCQGGSSCKCIIFCNLICCKTFVTHWFFLFCGMRTILHVVTFSAFVHCMAPICSAEYSCASPHVILCDLTSLQPDGRLSSLFISHANARIHLPVNIFKHLSKFMWITCVSCFSRVPCPSIIYAPICSPLCLWQMLLKQHSTQTLILFHGTLICLSCQKWLQSFILYSPIWSPQVKLLLLLQKFCLDDWLM